MPSRFEDVGVLTLAVEVVSPSTMRVDRFVKRREYQTRGVPEYWIVDPTGRSVERWRPGDEEPDILFDTLAWQPNPDVAPLTIDLARTSASCTGSGARESGPGAVVGPDPCARRLDVLTS
jgi:hypothetical protein